MKRVLIFLLGLFIVNSLAVANDVIIGNKAYSAAAPATLSGKVWWDENLNGIQDESNKGIAGIRVHLYKNGEDTGEMVLTQTMGEGNYTFENLEADANYTVKIDLPRNYSDFTLQNIGDDNSKDSDIVNWPFRSET
ncbi:MAG TPA: Cna B-type domain-containing protein, partial [Nitratifractor sp.]|nr:Cna B-type domain-containing protein [Nitratifractor sp.]